MGAQATTSAAGPITCTLAFAWRALLKIKHTPEQLFDLVASPILFTVLFTYMFGGAIAGSPEAYLPFLLPGMVVQTVVFATMYTGITLRTDLSKGVYDRFRSMPIWGPSPLVGAMLGDTVRYTLAGVLVFAVGAVMGYRPPGGDSGGGGGSWLGPAAAVVLLNAFAFGLSWVFTTLALLLRSPNTVMTLSWLILMPITFASNVYVTLESMPDWLRRIVSLNPVTHVTTATRALCNGEATAGQIGLALLGPAVLTAVLSPLAMLLYRRER